MPTINGDNNDNVLQDTSGDDILNGLGGHDRLRVTSGDDEANGGAGGDSLIIDWRAALNAVLTVVAPTAGANGLFGRFSDGTATRNIEYTGIERFEISTGSGADDIDTGNGHDAVDTGAGNDILQTGGGNDMLIGGSGVDSMSGGAGNDIYFIDNHDDGVIENANEGRDVAYATASYVLAPNVHLEVLSSAEIGALYFLDLTGNELPNGLIGNNGDNALDGGDGNDTLIAWSGNDVLTGGGGDDRLDGGADADRMIGGAGNDIYYVENGNDLIAEIDGQGYDRVFTSVSHTLTVGQSIELLAVSSIEEADPITLRGNEFGQELVANDGNNLLLGGGGADILRGHNGNDRLNGEGGADTLFGGKGDDIYYLYGSADVIHELIGEGRDVVYVDFSFVLPSGQKESNGFISEILEIEILSTASLSGTAAIDLTGNYIDNMIYGNNGQNTLHGGEFGDDVLMGLGGADSLNGWSGNDVLDGGAGADIMDGSVNNDTFMVDNPADVVIDNHGFDVVYATADYVLPTGSGIEVLSARSIASTAALNLTGNERANEIDGNMGDNALNGGGGRDALVGFGGADTFAFTTAIGVNNADRIYDFGVGADIIALDDAVFSGLAVGALPAGAFRQGTAAADADDRIIYDNATGALYFDLDGIGSNAALPFAYVRPGTTLGASDFVVF